MIWLNRVKIFMTTFQITALLNRFSRTIKKQLLSFRTLVVTKMTVTKMELRAFQIKLTKANFRLVIQSSRDQYQLSAKKQRSRKLSNLRTKRRHEI